MKEKVKEKVKGLVMGLVKEMGKVRESRLLNHYFQSHCHCLNRLHQARASPSSSFSSFSLF